MSSASSPPRLQERGFTLLEVMCAFALLAGLTAFVTRMFVNNIDKGTTALSRRELREVADTIFRKMIYMHQEYQDGDSRTLDEEYGEFARLRGAARDRWHAYRYVLEKKEKTVVGTDPEGEESLFDESDEERRDSSTTSSSGETTSEGEGETAGGIRLLRLTLMIYRTDEPDQRPLITIGTWIDPNKGEDVLR